MAMKIKQSLSLDSTSSQKTDLLWTPQMEVKLFEMMLTHKPAGIAKHFNMAVIHYKLSQQEGFKNLTSENIWKHLEEFFDMEKADSTEGSFLQGNSDSGHIEFCLPNKDFEDAMAEIRKGSKPQDPKAGTGKQKNKTSGSKTSIDDTAVDMEAEDKASDGENQKSFSAGKRSRKTLSLSSSSKRGKN